MFAVCFSIQLFFSILLTVRTLSLENGNHDLLLDEWSGHTVDDLDDFLLDFAHFHLYKRITILVDNSLKSKTNT